MFLLNREAIWELAAKYKVGIIVNGPNWFPGALITYGSSSDGIAAAASYLDKILRGAKAAELPIEQATKIEMGVNMKIAKAVGVTIPSEVLIRADQVIQ